MKKILLSLMASAAFFINETSAQSLTYIPLNSSSVSVNVEALVLSTGGFNPTNPTLPGGSFTTQYLNYTANGGSSSLYMLAGIPQEITVHVPHSVLGTLTVNLSLSDISTLNSSPGTALSKYLPGGTIGVVNFRSDGYNNITFAVLWY